MFAAFFDLPTGLAGLIKEISAAYVAAIQIVDTDDVVRLSRRLYEIAQAVIDERRARLGLEELLRRTSAIEAGGPVESARMPEIGAVSVPVRLRPA
ncbi:hypothetical protein [Nonomuraea rubra]|uniref:hypothetical protein n=1 Tax=Nonomuraea rubra TaxID=46180 RepID=UPI00340895BE